MKPGSSWTKQRLVYTISAISLVAAGAVTISVIHASSIQSPQGWHLLLAFAALLVADSALVDIRTGSEAESVTFAEAMLALCIVLVPWAYLLPMAGLAVITAHALRGRQW